MNVARQLALGDVAQRESEPLPLDAHDDQADAGPGVEPAVQELQLGRARRELEEAEGGAEIVHARSRSVEPPKVIFGKS